MKTSHLRFIAFSALLYLICMGTQAEDLRRVVSLSGNWKFSIGDDSKWASPSFDDSDWDNISVPDQWENQGYDDYNGYAWYRKTFIASAIPSGTTIYLLMGQIDDADEVYLNGKKIGKTGKFPPNFSTAYNIERKYIIPAGLLNDGKDNVIAVKVYDSFQGGGIVNGPTGIYVDEDIELLNLDLTGNWKFQTGDNKGWKAPEFDDAKWSEIAVPSAWENQGYEDYDGYAWYRLKFSLPQNFTTDELYMSLGKIDDIDDVYLNGQHIGNVYDLRKSSSYRWFSGDEYNTRRLYSIPEGLLNRNGSNTLAVRVRDDQGLGGIYEGPIGIMSANNYQRYKSRHRNTYRSFWGYVLDNFINDDNSWEE